MAIRLLVAAALGLAVLVGSALARADDRAALEARARDADPRVASEALFQLAQRDEEALAFAAALEGYRAAIARFPSSRWTPRATARASYLAAHAEGDFAPLARLEQVRRDPALASDRGAIDALARDADAFPPGLVRVEAWLLCAEAYGGRLDRGDRAVALYERVIDDPRTDGLTRREAAQAIVQRELDRGEIDAAARAARGHEALLEPRLRAAVVSARRRRWLHDASIALLAIVAALTAGALVAAARAHALSRVTAALRGTTPFALLFAAYVAGVGGALASGYEMGNAAPFVAFGGALGPLLLVSRAWGAAGSARAPARAARAVLCAAAVVAAAFLTLERIDVTYLTGFGL